MQEKIFHALNRGTDKRKIFFTTEDYLRFTHNMSDFNNREIAFLSYRNRRHYSEVSAPKEEDKIVDVLCWALMPNHFHILLQERRARGASMFIQKLTGGYTMYFNPRHQRSGTLFQGRSKILSVNDNPHFLHLPFYILANPLDIFQSNWKEKGLKDIPGAINFLEKYKWSSFHEIADPRGNSSVINTELFFNLFDWDKNGWKKEFTAWLQGYDPTADSFNFRS